MTILCDRCTELDVISGIRGLALYDASRWTESSVVPSPWHDTLATVIQSATLCQLCALVIKGWREYREVMVADETDAGNFPVQDPPEDLSFDIADITVYQAAGAVKLELRHGERKLEIGSRLPDYVYVMATCQPLGPGSQGSWSVHGALVTEFRVFFDPDAVPPLEITQLVQQDTVQGRKLRKKGSRQPNSNNYPHIPAKLLDESVATDPLSDRSLKIAQEWLSVCVEMHGERCTSPQRLSWESMPTRVLDIPPDGTKIYLRISSEARPEDGRYVALSHCWGSADTPFTTTRATIHQRMDGIDFQELPQTFIDATKIVRALGLRYIWIDSLCIIQEPEDWAIESAKMADVYRNAHLVLGAASGSSDALGFLGPRTTHDTIRLPSQPSGAIGLQLLPAKGSFGGSRRGSRWWTSNAGLDRDPLSDEPLTGRAWCLQERYLPRRCLQYGSRQMIWECEQIIASEEGDVLTHAGNYLRDLCNTATIQNSVFRRNEEHRSPHWEDVEIKWVGWHRMVEKYSSRRITYATDKLLALSGLAKALARDTGQRDYIAGLWRAGLLEGMIWCRKEAHQIMTKPSTWVAPSYSWASVQEPVQFPIYSWHTTRAFWKARMGDFEALAEYDDYSAELMDGDAYGRLKKASLSIVAPILPVRSIRERPPEPPRASYLHDMVPYPSAVMDKIAEVHLDDGNVIWIDCYFDIQDEEADIGNLFVVFLTRMPNIVRDGFFEHRFGILVQNLEDGTYRRVGLADGCLLETRRAALSRWIEYTPEYWRHEEADKSEEEVEALIAGFLTQLRGIELEQESSGTADMLECIGYRRRTREEGDMYDAEPPNILAPNPIELQRHKLTLV